MEPVMDSAQNFETSHESAGRMRRLRLVLSERGREIATECDRWFVGAFVGVVKGTQWAKSGLGALGRRLVPRAWKRREARRDRIRRLLLAEARRANLPVSDGDLRLFLENMATVLELVLGGAIGIDDIAFEQDLPAGGGGDPQGASVSTSGRDTIDAHWVQIVGRETGPGSPELGEEVADAHEPGQYQEEPAL
jgi:hypothetical protein